MNISLTVFFEEPFWVGIFERTNNGEYEVSRIVFGAEPKDYEVYKFVLNNFRRLHFTKPLKDEKVTKRRINPKRLQRKIKKEVVIGIGTKAQNAIKLDLEARKEERRIFIKSKKKEYEENKFRLKQEKKKKKKRGH
ncbi:hypothetical protein BJV85_002423 [Clostridium acetobutylicum]|uniref:Uncharacterized protein, YJDF B.subtilis ortholog n=1 Tax=Clostridium acetobutylicum (strain ATCC 824 / DSM 792 / JCM 1419 / IAM 19013 / LMG 5710 / NBRC 13948 / NRRL B-527 / VKM B-1787 / 2291 / W) TaxID=272562 RepID=Q97IR7_CLOAB|nr:MULTISPECIES: YjdF family protein [Clostridium]AAK79540.1 Uncharacterized protein, YJDF B.subtilis ortholog [Clostridium acetobutylicum ATCC 824]ADZ20625.1 Conserved hypothetical protein [Clostridium acetobutylicum EA 2018]AEI31875.1 hypothetical protein SMB_G1598 [Clostridium acetobutylicum DSM 1731]AWV81217.1 DUF2992 family protein [Clostridium acetobutylicum]MBC2392848.1 YjdF family protein [Clostridium acetobutylicum]